MDLRKIRRLIKLLEGTDVGEIEIQEGEERVRITRYKGNPRVVVGDTGGGTLIETQAAPAVPPAATAEAAPANDKYQVRSPMVGTFYASSQPGKPPFVTPGQQVRQGDVLGIIEGMKVMNQIEAPRGGVVTAVLVENGEAVEYDQPLLELGD